MPMTRSVTAIVCSLLAASCGSSERTARPTKPPAPAGTPTELIAEGDATGCGDASFRRFTDRRARFSFCAPAGSKVGWLSVVEETNTVEQMWFAPDDSSNFAASVLGRASTSDMGPGTVPNDGTLDFDERGSLAGRAARHFRMRWHDHRDRSSVVDEHGRHGHEEASDHDVTVERWALAWGNGGMLSLTIRTQDNTSEA